MVAVSTGLSQKTDPRRPMARRRVPQRPDHLFCGPAVGNERQREANQGGVVGCDKISKCPLIARQQPFYNLCIYILRLRSQVGLNLDTDAHHARGVQTAGL